MLTDSASIILFAIQSTVKLGRQARKAYVDSTRRRKLVLPMVKFYNSTGYMDALTYFKDPDFGKPYVDGGVIDGHEYEGSEVLKTLLAKPPDQLSREDKKALESLHEKYVNIDRAREGELSWQDDEPITAVELEAIFTVGQWQSGADPTPSTLHRMAGTIIEIGVDYALNSPDLLDRKSKKGKAIHGFLTALDDIDLAETDLSELPARLFVATMETTAENPELMSGDLKVQEFIKVTTKALSQEAARHINEINNNNELDVIAKREARLKVEDWGELVFRSTLSSGGRLIVSDPVKFLGVKDAGHEALISSVGKSTLDLILSDDDGLGNVLSREGLEVVISAALKTVGEHPEIVTHTNNEGLQTLISELALELSQNNNLLERDIFPEIVRMMLEKSGENLELFWPDLVNDPKKNLILTAAKTALTVLSREPTDNESWKPQFTKSDLLLVTEKVLDELVESPGWLIVGAGELNGTLEEVLKSTLDVLRKNGTNRLSTSVGVKIISDVLKTIALRQEFTAKLPNGQMIISAALDAILSKIFNDQLDEKASWQLLKVEVIEGIVQLTMKKLALTTLDQDCVDKLQECIDDQITAIVHGKIFSIESLAECFNTKLAIT